MSLAEWITQYTAALPPQLRPAGDDQRFITAARNAQANQWTPGKAAHIVANRTYQGATNPTLLAIKRLEETGAYPPHQPRPTSTWTPPNDDRIPDQWVAERIQLIRRIAASGQGPETLEQAMTDLIAEQKGRQ